MNWPSRCCGLESCKKKTIKPSPNQLSTYKSDCASARIITLDNYYRRKTVWSNGRTIRKLMGGRAGEVEKNIFEQWKIKWKENYACQLTPKNIHATVWKKSMQGIWWGKKIPGARKFAPPPPPPYNFSNGPSLIDVISFSRCASSCSLYLFPFLFGSSPDKSQYDLSIFCRSPPGIKAEIL